MVAEKAQEKKDGVAERQIREIQRVPEIQDCADHRHGRRPQHVQPFVLLQGDFASFSKSQPLSQAGTNNLKSSGENIRRARIGFQGIIDKDFSYSFVADFGGAGDETCRAYAGPNTGTTKNAAGTSLTPYTASTASGTGARIFNAWVGLQRRPRAVHVPSRRAVDARQSQRHDAV